MSTSKPGLLLVISGPSGTGKGTVLNAIRQANPFFQYSISATTRQPRVGEQHGREYFFFEKAVFEDMIANDNMLEWAEVYGNYYGTPRSYVDEKIAQGYDVVLEIDTQGAMQVKAKIPNAVFIYIVPPSLNELANRINKRGADSEESINKRLGEVKREVSFAYNYNYIVVNDKLENAVNAVQSIINAEKSKVERNIGLIDHLYKYGDVSEE